MVHALFVTLDAGGNLPPELGIAAELQRRGLGVRFLGHPGQRAAVEAAGMRFEAFPTGLGHDPTSARPTLRAVRDIVRLFADTAIAADTLASVRREPTDLVVVDCLLLGTLAATVAAGIPTVSLVHTFWHYFERTARGPIGALLRLHGVPMRRVLAAADLGVVTTLRDFDPAGHLPPRVQHVGAVWQGVPQPAVPDGGRPRVLVSLSTTWFPGQDRTMQAILDALAGLPVDAIVTTGPALDPATLRLPANATAHRWLDHAPVLERASLVVGHGGHSTAMRALSYGVPLLVLPMHPLLDQPMVATAVVQHGAGLAMPRTASAERIRLAIEALLADPRYRSQAQQVGRRIRARDGAAVAADLIDELGSRRYPVRS